MDHELCGDYFYIRHRRITRAKDSQKFQFKKNRLSVVCISVSHVSLIPAVCWSRPGLGPALHTKPRDRLGSRFRKWTNRSLISIIYHGQCKAYCELFSDLDVVPSKWRTHEEHMARIQDNASTEHTWRQERKMAVLFMYHVQKTQYSTHVPVCGHSGVITNCEWTDTIFFEFIL